MLEYYCPIYTHRGTSSLVFTDKGLAIYHAGDCLAHSVKVYDFEGTRLSTEGGVTLGHLPAWEIKGAALLEAGSRNKLVKVTATYSCEPDKSDDVEYYNTVVDAMLELWQLAGLADDNQVVELEGCSVTLRSPDGAWCRFDIKKRTLGIWLTVQSFADDKFDEEGVEDGR
jgi:hypothetical protein